jgi:hypothetical protein
MLSRFFDLDSHVPLSGPDLDQIWTESGPNLELGKNRLDQFWQPPNEYVKLAWEFIGKPWRENWDFSHLKKIEMTQKTRKLCTY